jgi:PPOX class probable F420-dependent enzyme
MVHMTDTNESALWDRLFQAREGTLVTLKRDGRPQLSVVTVGGDPTARTLGVSTTATRAKVHNLRRDPRASFLVTSAERASYYVVGEGTAQVGEVARSRDDDAVQALVDLYRSIAGEHPDWDDFRRAMVEDQRLVLTVTVERVYGWVSPTLL